MSEPGKQLTEILRSEVIHLDGVVRVSPSRRFTPLFEEGSVPDTVYFVDSGLVKIYKSGSEGKEIILEIVVAGELVGLQTLHEGLREVSAEVLHEGAIYAIPKDAFVEYCDSHTGMWRLLQHATAARKRALERKIELLCLQDVEYRILYYLAELAETLAPFAAEDGEHGIPLSQGELASLIGATRETTSTTLNALARKGLLRLGRRQVIVPSVEAVQNAAEERNSRAVRAGS